MGRILMRLVILITGIVLIGSGLAYLFFQEHLMLLLAGVAQFVKVVWVKLLQITISDLWILLLPFFKRFLALELPKKIVASLGPIFLLGPKTRRKLRVYLKQIKRHARRAKNYVWLRMERRFGRRPAIALSILAMIGAFVLGVVFFGTYVVIWFGFIRLPRFLLRFFGSVGVIAGEWLKRKIFTAITFLHLDRLWRFLHGRLRPDHKRRLSALRYLILRSVITSRHRVVRQLEQRRKRRGHTKVEEPAE